MAHNPLIRFWTVVAAIALLALPAAAQGQGQVAMEYRRSLDILRDYRWKSKVETSVNGELTGSRLYDVAYSEEGALTRTLIEDEGRKKTTKPEEQAGLALGGIRRLIDAYIHMKPEQMQQRPCRLTAEFEDIENGPTIVVRSVFEMEQMKKKEPTGKTMVVVTENFDHQRR